MPEGILRTLLVLLLAGGGVLFVVQRIVDYLLFQPSVGIDFTPEELGIQAESFHLATEDSVRVHAFYLPAARSDRALLFLHGNAGNASHRLPNAALLAAMDINVLLVDYRGYGLSDGAPSEPGLYADARAGLAHLVAKRGIPEERIVIFGRSLGGAVAIDLAQNRPLAGVIVESTFSSLRDMVAGYTGPLAGLIARGHFDTITKVGSLRAPLLAFHGDSDQVVPYTLGARLYEAVPTPKAFEVLKGAGHNDTLQSGGEPYLARIQAFIDRVAPR